MQSWTVTFYIVFLHDYLSVCKIRFYKDTHFNDDIFLSIACISSINKIILFFLTDENQP